MNLTLVSSQINNKRFEIVNFPFLDEDVPLSPYSFCKSIF